MTDAAPASVAHSAEAKDLDAAETSENHGVEQGDVQVSTEAAKTADVVPDGGYGWVCVWAVSLINAHTWGLNSVGGGQAL